MSDTVFLTPARIEAQQRAGAEYYAMSDAERECCDLADLIDKHEYEVRRELSERFDVGGEG